MRYSGGSATMDMTARVSVSVSGPSGTGTATYPVRFTTQQATATNLAGTKTVSITGEPVVRSSRYVQLVAATPNRRDAFPEPGSAVYTVLSGTFDHPP
jgi:hypothetical protein